jgi:hypothetical protein
MVDSRLGRIGSKDRRNAGTLFRLFRDFFAAWEREDYSRLGTDPSKPGLYTLLLKLGPNQRIEAHFHQDDRVAVE